MKWLFDLAFGFAIVMMVAFFLAITATASFGVWLVFHPGIAVAVKDTIAEAAALCCIATLFGGAIAGMIAEYIHRNNKWNWK